MSLLKQFQESHRHPLNRACHVSAFILLLLGVFLYSTQWRLALVLGLLASGLLIIGHRIEGKYPAFIHRFLEKVLGTCLGSPGSAGLLERMVRRIRNLQKSK